MNTLFISFFQPDTYVYNAGEELENIFNRLLKISFPNFEDVFLEDSIEEEKDQQQETPYLANCQYGCAVFLGELVFKTRQQTRWRSRLAHESISQFQFHIFLFYLLLRYMDIRSIFIVLLVALFAMKFTNLVVVALHRYIFNYFCYSLYLLFSLSK